MSAIAASSRSTGVLVEGRPRSRSFSSTPTFSSDLAKLRAATGSGGTSGIVHSYRDAIAIASTWDVLGPHSPLKRKVKLETEEDWKEFFQVAVIKNDGDSATSGAITQGQQQAASNEAEVEVSIQLEKLLRHCFDVAYKMPISPSSKVLKASHARSASVGGSPPSLQI